MGKRAFDLEDCLDMITALLKANLGTKMAAIDSEKADGSTMRVPPTDEGYFFQDLNGKQINADPFVLVTFMGLEGNPQESWPGGTKTRAEISVSIAWVDQEGDPEPSRRALRNLRALTEVIEEGFDASAYAGKLVIADQNVVPIQLLNSVQGHRATGVLIRADLG